MVAALQTFLDDLAHVQRRSAVAAHVEQGRDAVLLVAEQHDGLVADAAGQRRLADLVGPGGDIPGVADEHGGFPPCSDLVASVVPRGTLRKLLRECTSPRFRGDDRPTGVATC
jgi:hypothetical protein